MRHAALAKSKSRIRSVAEELTNSNVSSESMVILGTASTLVGLWAVACMVGAMLSSGGPIALARAWISAVTGG